MESRHLSFLKQNHWRAVKLSKGPQRVVSIRTHAAHNGQRESIPVTSFSSSPLGYLGEGKWSLGIEPYLVRAYWLTTFRDNCAFDVVLLVFPPVCWYLNGYKPEAAVS